MGMAKGAYVEMSSAQMKNNDTELGCWVGCLQVVVP